MNPIFIPLNLVADCENVVKYALSVGKRSGAHLSFFHTASRKLLKNADHSLRVEGAEAQALIPRLKSQLVAEKFSHLLDRLLAQEISFSFTFVSGNSLQDLYEQSQKEPYEFVMTGTYAMSGLRNAFQGPLSSRIIGKLNLPVFVVPNKGPFAEIQHITYAVDLTDYDPNVIRQVKLIAGMFDAKLSIAHVNSEPEEGKRASYLTTLEKTISDTLDYPKVYYKFFDHVDPISGIKKFVNLNNCNLLAMINRKKFNWRNLFRRDDSLTRRMARELTVPILAFQKL